MKGKNMHFVNKILSVAGLQLMRTTIDIGPEEKKDKRKFTSGLAQAKNNQRGFEVIEVYRNEVGMHPRKQQDLEFEFVAYHIKKVQPVKILDIGTYRHFILGLLAHFDVTTVDVRQRESTLENETVITCDAKSLIFLDDTFDFLVSLQCLPHIGLGRYGDEFDLDGDIKAFQEMVRVLKPGGMLIFSTAITGGNPVIAWNARRNYSYAMIKKFCVELDLIEEKFIDRQSIRYCAKEELTTDPNFFDYYIGCWKKRAA